MARKMLKQLVQLDDDCIPLGNLSEVHLQRVMSTKVGPENTYRTRDEQGNSIASVHFAEVAVVKETMTKAAKVLESCLYGESVRPSLIMNTFVQSLRQILQTEIYRQQSILDSQLFPPNALTKLQVRSRTSLPPIRKTSAPLQRETPVLDWKLNVVRMMLDRNADIERRMKAFAQEYKERHSFDTPSPVSMQKPSSLLVAKAIRARNYEKQSKSLTVSSAASLSKLRALPSTHFDMDSPYFDERLSVSDRVKIIRSCVVIQRYFLKHCFARAQKAACKIQAAYRGYFVRRAKLYSQYKTFRSAFFAGRLAHWLPLLANKFKERKNRQYFQTEKYAAYISYILKIQQVARGYITRKALATRFQVHMLQLRKAQGNLRLYNAKKQIWRLYEARESTAIAKEAINFQPIGRFERGVKASREGTELSWLMA
jgi:hypothetical protein